MITHSDDEFEKRWEAMPEGKLELIDGQLIISTPAGSRRIAEQTEQHVKNLLGQAIFETVDGIYSETVYRGEVPGNDALRAYADSELECRSELAEAAQNWVRLRLARGEKLPCVGI